MGDLKEEEREDKCGEVDHRERAGLWTSLGLSLDRWGPQREASGDAHSYMPNLKQCFLDPDLGPKHCRTERTEP